MASPRRHAERSAFPKPLILYVVTIFTKLKRYFLILCHVVLFHVTVQHVIGHNLMLKQVSSVAVRSASEHARIIK